MLESLGELFKNAHPNQLNQNFWGDSSAPKQVFFKHSPGDSDV